MRGTPLFLVTLLSMGLLGLGCGDDSGGKGTTLSTGDGDGDGDASGDGDGDASGDGDGDGDASGDGDGDVSGDGDGDGDSTMNPCTVDPDDPLCAIDPDPNTFDPGPVQDGWLCTEEQWGDIICDCGCGIDDPGCNFFVGVTGCTMPGCIDEQCNACFTTEQTIRPGVMDGDDWFCAEAIGVEQWHCSAAKLDDANNVCDCGCGAPDPDCGGQGCYEAGCWNPACNRRHEMADSNDVGERVQAAVNSPSSAAGWDCAPSFFGDGKCDCGCGAPDPDCGANQGCQNPLCNDAFCRVCHDADGRVIRCSSDYQAAGQIFCPAWRLGQQDGVCDCGCGVRDPDCGNGGCVDPDCEDARCDRCVSDRYIVSGCAVPAGFTCGEQHYGTGDGCDCGCGVPDPDCDPGCVNDGCTADSCDFCHDQAGTVPTSCGGWTCDNAFFNEGGLNHCDCGCGEGDPDCRYGPQYDKFTPFCTDDGCELGSCDRCRDGGDTPTACGGWAAGPCDADRLNNGVCDCGCGALDPECGVDEDGGQLGCAAGTSCAYKGCELCWNAQDHPVDCNQWHCSTAEYGDGVCDCGCGARDADCLNGCIDPGCEDSVGVCVVCHDYWGRVVQCP